MGGYKNVIWYIQSQKSFHFPITLDIKNWIFINTTILKLISVPVRLLGSPEYVFSPKKVLMAVFWDMFQMPLLK